MNDHRPAPWEQQPWQTAANFHAFHTYFLSLQPPRSLLKAYQRYRLESGSKQAPKSAPGLWNLWAQGRDSRGERIPGALTWTQQAAAWDVHLAELDRQKWEQRRLDLRETEYTEHERLIALADQILAEAPNFIQTRRKLIKAKIPGQNDLEVVTLRLNLELALKAIELASKLGRRAAEMDTESVKVTWEDSARAAGIDPEAAKRQFAKLLLNRPPTRPDLPAPDKDDG